MKIGIIVDGQAEYRSLQRMLPRIDTNNDFIKILYADVQPRARTAKVVLAALPAIRVLGRKGARRILLLLDHDNRPVCIARWRTELEDALVTPCRINGVVEVSVVLKAEMYENWLVSDPRAIKSMPQRFSLSDAHERQISPDRADRVDATRILKATAQGAEYHKINDAVRIMSRFDPLIGARNSRSFRCFLRTAGSRTYSGQSRMP
jgi:Domain of unknown function (DUF4276)